MSLEGVALAEFNALRSEVQSIRQIQTAVYTAALTILSAVGGFALAKKEGRLEMLLVLPIVLSGLGLILVESEIGISNIGAYIREDLSERLPTDNVRSSWELFIDKRRNERRRKYSWLGVAAPSLILLAPSVASIVIEREQATTSLLPLFWGGVIAMGVFLWALAGRVKEAAREQRKGECWDAQRPGSARPG
jgi:drug/metabolite transporter (DMT)-like permease